MGVGMAVKANEIERGGQQFCMGSRRQGEVGQGCFQGLYGLGQTGDCLQWVGRCPHLRTPTHTHTHSFLGLSVSGGEKGAVLVLETSGPMAFFARRRLEMAWFPWCEPLGKPQGENESGGLSLNSKEQLSQPLPRGIRCPRGTAGSRSLSPTHTHITTHAHTPTHTHTQSLTPIISSYLEPQKETQTRGLL